MVATRGWLKFSDTKVSALGHTSPLSAARGAHGCCPGWHSRHHRHVRGQRCSGVEGPVTCREERLLTPKSEAFFVPFFRGSDVTKVRATFHLLTRPTCVTATQESAGQREAGGRDALREGRPGEPLRAAPVLPPSRRVRSLSFSCPTSFLVPPSLNSLLCSRSACQQCPCPACTTSPEEK